MNYGSNPAPAWTHSTNAYTTDGGTPGTTAAINTAAGCSLFIDASAGGVVIPPWSNVLYCAVGTEASNAWCYSGYIWTGACSYAPIYIIYGTNGLTSGGNYLDHSSPLGTIRYFEIVFPIGGSCDEFYQYDADLELDGNIDGHAGDGANELYTAAGVSTNTGSPEDVTQYAQSCNFLDAASLPIKLVSFTANYNSSERDVQLNWTTETEVNNKYFTILKSQDGVTWQAVSTLPGAGNSNYVINYTSIDESPFPGTSYYRLKQTDFDGKYTYSNPVAVNIDPLANVMTLIPNPASNTTSVTFNSILAGNGSLSVYDLAGRLIDTRQLDLLKGVNTYILTVANYTNGMYLVTINNSMQQLSAKLIINHN